MILHLSAALAKRLKIQLTFAKEKILQTGRADSWSADLFISRKHGKFIFVMHDASMWPILMPLKACPTYEAFLASLLRIIQQAYLSHGVSFDVANQNIIVTKRSNRSFIGYMNDAKFHLDVMACQNRDAPPDWPSILCDIARLPFNAKGVYFTPARKFSEMAKASS
jgi:hypothetical protein